MWCLRHKPLGVPEYGRYTFHDQHGFSSTLQEKATVIDQYLKAITIFKNASEEARKALLESKKKAAQEKAYQETPSLGSMVQQVWKNAEPVVVVASAAFNIFMALRGASSDMPSLPASPGPKPSLPNHVTVGGGHMGFGRNITVGGGHLTNAINNFSSTADYSKIPNNDSRSLIKKCTMEYPTPSDIKEQEARYENERLEQIRWDYQRAVANNRTYGTPIDIESFQKQIEKLADETGRQAWSSLLQAIAEAASAGIAIEIPPIAIYEAYQAVRDFKQFGALAEEEQRLRDLADRWGK